MRGCAPIFAVLLAAGDARAAALTAKEQAGKRIYLHGESPGGGGINAQIGDTTLPGSAVACASCHGEDGLGRPEGGVVPSITTWSYLTKRYGHVHEDGRRHPAYTEETLARAIAGGVDPAGNALDPSMPLYSMSRADMESLLAYLRRLEHDRDPGIGPRSIRVGTVLPGGERLGGIGRAIRQVLSAQFARLNEAGGVNGRRLDLVTSEHDGSRQSCIAAARRLIEEERVFVLVSGFCPSAEGALAALAEREKVPLLGPLTPFTRQAGELPDRYVFYVLPGVREQARALVDHGADELAPNSPAAIVHASREPLAEAARAALEQARARGWTSVDAISYPGGAVDAELVSDLKQRGVEVVVFLGNDVGLSSFARAADALAWAPRVLLSISLAARAAADAPPPLRDRILLAYSTLPSDERPVAREHVVRASAGPGDTHRAARVSAYTAAALLVEGLRRSGRHLSRERLVDKVEALHAFVPGLVPPLTYNANRRVGALGAYVVALDRDGGGFRPLRWVALSERPQRPPPTAAGQRSPP